MQRSGPGRRRDRHGAGAARLGRRHPGQDQERRSERTDGHPRRWNPDHAPAHVDRRAPGAAAWGQRQGELRGEGRSEDREVVRGVAADGEVARGVPSPGGGTSGSAARILDSHPEARDKSTAVSAFDDIGGVIAQLGLTSRVLIGLSMGGRNAIYFTSKRPELIQRLVIVDIGPEVSKRAALAPAGPAEPDTWESIEQAAQHLYRGNPNPGIHYYRWVVSASLRQRADGLLVWAWHPSVKERRSPLDIDWWAVLRAITPPTPGLRGESSTVLDRDVAARVGKELPRGRFLGVPRAVHTLHEDNPAAVLAPPRGFLE